jgi:hypothetical protein
VVQGDHLGAELRVSLTPVARVSEADRSSDADAGAAGFSLYVCPVEVVRYECGEESMRVQTCPRGLPATPQWAARMIMAQLGRKVARNY